MYGDRLCLTVRTFLCLLITALLSVRGRWSGGAWALLLYIVLSIFLLSRVYTIPMFSAELFSTLFCLLFTLFLRLFFTIILIRLCSILETFYKIRDAAGKQN